MSETVRLVYAGRRVSDYDKPLVNAWVDVADGNRELYFAKVVGTALGGVYEVKVEREDGAIRSAYSNPRFTGDKHDDDWDQLVAWQALDADARKRDQLRRLEKRLAKSAELDQVVRSMRPLMRKATTFTDAEKIVNTIRNRLMQEWHTPS